MLFLISNTFINDRTGRDRKRGREGGNRFLSVALNELDNMPVREREDPASQVTVLYVVLVVVSGDETGSVW